MVRKLIPASVRRPVRAAQNRWSNLQLRRRWANAATPVRLDPAWPPKTVLFVPCDPNNLIGSRGDEAMIAATLSTLAAGGPVRTFMITGSDKATSLARSLGVEPLQLWRRQDFVQAMIDALAEVRPDAVFVLGADVIDGYYNPQTSMRLLISADVAARARIPAVVLGFSFNAKAAPAIRSVLDALHPDVRLNLREAISLERFRAFTTATPRLVADVAFLLQPSPEGPAYVAAAKWVAERRAAGRRVFGFNAHPMLFKKATPEKLENLVGAAANSIRTAHAESDTAWLLLPHDFRGVLGDNTCLEPLAQRLEEDLGADLMHLPGEPKAAELKAVAGLLDGVIAGRMHLAIAALGMGVPAAAMTYQDKFKGLFQHFDLPEWLLLAPEDLDRPGKLGDVVARFVSEAEALRAQVSSKLPDVRNLARKNLQDVVA